MHTSVLILAVLGFLSMQACAEEPPATPQANPATDVTAQAAQQHMHGVPDPRHHGHPSLHAPAAPIYRHMTGPKNYGNSPPYPHGPDTDRSFFDHPTPDYRTAEGYPHQGYGDYPRGPRRDGDPYDRPTPDFRTSRDYPGRYDYEGPHHQLDKHYLTKGCNGALPPTCQTHLPQTDYYHDDHPPACASTGATYAWAANCANPTAVDGSCQGVALCPINGAAATATATCTAVGWVVTNNCQPARCAAAPGAPPNGTSTCSVPGVLNQVCGATCSGGLTPAIAAVCTANGWDVSGCCVPADFDLYNVGSINNQPTSLPVGQAWTTQDSFGAVYTWDEEVVTVAGKNVWRISNAITKGSFSDQPMTYTSCEVAGETGSALFNVRPLGNAIGTPLPGAYATSNQFYWRVSFKSATGVAQSGLTIELASNAKYSTWRMSRLVIRDAGNGFNLTAIDVFGNITSGATISIFTPIANGLSYTEFHTIETRILFVDGITDLGNNIVGGNDVLQVYLNGTLIHTGSTNEAYYYVSPASATEGLAPPRRQATDCLMFRVSDPAVTGTSGKGFYFSDVVVSNAFPVA